MADGREISMDYVAKPTSYEPQDSNLPPGFEPTPRIRTYPQELGPG